MSVGLFRRFSPLVIPSTTVPSVQKSWRLTTNMWCLPFKFRQHLKILTWPFSILMAPNGEMNFDWRWMKISVWTSKHFLMNKVCYSLHHQCNRWGCMMAKSANAYSSVWLIFFTNENAEYWVTCSTIELTNSVEVEVNALYYYEKNNVSCLPCLALPLLKTDPAAFALSTFAKRLMTSCCIANLEWRIMNSINFLT